MWVCRYVGMQVCRYVGMICPHPKIKRLTSLNIAMTSHVDTELVISDALFGFLVKKYADSYA